MYIGHILSLLHNILKILPLNITNYVRNLLSFLRMSPYVLTLSPLASTPLYCSTLRHHLPTLNRLDLLKSDANNILLTVTVRTRKLGHPKSPFSLETCV